MVGATIFLATFCAIAFYTLYKEEQALNEEAMTRQNYWAKRAYIAEIKYIKYVRKVRDTVYYDPYSDEIVMCNRLYPIGRVDEQE